MNEPVRNAGALSAAIITVSTAIVAWMSAMGYIHWTESQQALTAGLVTALVDLAGILIPMFWVRRQVTPLASPRNRNGEPLYSARQFAAMQPLPPSAVSSQQSRTAAVTRTD